jgi:hypothetical protein
MSLAAVRTALETKLNVITPALATSWENVPYTPVTGTPYQACFLMPSTPDNPTLGDGYYREQGLLQVSLFYPLQAGPQTAEIRAELIRTTFKRGTAMTSGSVKVLVDRTPEIGQGRVDDDRWMIHVKIRWSAGIIA